MWWVIGRKVSALTRNLRNFYPRKSCLWIHLQMFQQWLEKSHTCQNCCRGKSSSPRKILRPLDFLQFIFLSQKKQRRLRKYCLLKRKYCHLRKAVFVPLPRKKKKPIYLSNICKLTVDWLSLDRTQT